MVIKRAASIDSISPHLLLDSQKPIFSLDLLYLILRSINHGSEIFLGGIVLMYYVNRRFASFGRGTAQCEGRILVLFVFLTYSSFRMIFIISK
jgi:hypothetical protein